MGLHRFSVKTPWKVVMYRHRSCYYLSHYNIFWEPELYHVIIQLPYHSRKPLYTENQAQDRLILMVHIDRLSAYVLPMHQF